MFDNECLHYCYHQSHTAHMVSTDSGSSIARCFWQWTAGHVLSSRSDIVYNQISTKIYNGFGFAHQTLQLVTIAWFYIFWFCFFFKWVEPHLGYHPSHIWPQCHRCCSSAQTHQCTSSWFIYTQAAATGDLDEFRPLLREVTIANRIKEPGVHNLLTLKDKKGFTPLHHAVINGHTHIIVEALEKLSKVGEW